MKASRIQLNQPSARRVLIVEDMPSMRQLIRELLETEGHLVDEAGDLETAHQLLERRTYHVAVVDIILGSEVGNRDGLHLLQTLNNRRISAADRGIGTRTVVLTAQDDPQMAADIMLLFGADDYIDKGQYRATLAQEILDRVNRQLDQCELALYAGSSNVIEFLAGGNESAWSSKALNVLRPKGGYPALRTFFSHLCDPLAPLVPAVGASSATVVDDDLKYITARFWSKSLALPVSILVGSASTIEEISMRDAPSEWKEDKIVFRYNGQGVTGIVFELIAVARSDFAEVNY